MRPAVRLLARYLDLSAPTGITGLQTHPAPRRALLNRYKATLQKLKEFPESSLYRQSVESVTKHRLALAERLVPPGYDEWKAKVDKVLSEHPSVQFKYPEPEVDIRSREAEWDGEADDTKMWAALKEAGSQGVDQVSALPTEPATLADHTQKVLDQNWHEEAFGAYKDIMGKEPEMAAPKEKEFDEAAFEQYVKFHQQEGSKKSREQLRKTFESLPEATETKVFAMDHPPDLTADQIAELENSIGAGLIEEVIEVAEAELKLVGIMAEAKVWEPLEEKPVEGQWTYFERNSS